MKKSIVIVLGVFVVVVGAFLLFRGGSLKEVVDETREHTLRFSIPNGWSRVSGYTLEQGMVSDELAEDDLTYTSSTFATEASYGPGAMCVVEIFVTSEHYEETRSRFDIENQPRGTRVVSDETITIGGKDWLKTVFVMEFDEDEDYSDDYDFMNFGEYRDLRVRLFDNGVAYVLEFITNEENFEDCEKDFNHIINSLRIR